MKAKPLLVAALLVLASFSYLWGIERDLPWAPESDEVRFLTLSAGIVATGDLNPHWFGHPGSTFIYPYAAGLQALIALHNSASPDNPKPGVKALEGDPAQAILVGRLISVAFGVLALWLVYLVGERAFGTPAGLIGAWWALLSPLTLDHVEMARTDGAGLFFGMLAIWSLLRLLQQPSRGNQILAGLCLGLGIATRYFLAGLLPLLLVIDWVLLSRRTAEEHAGQKIDWLSVLLGFVAVAIGIGVGAPFLITEIPTVIENLAHETRAGHPGADGLSYLGNLHWYFTVAFPRSVPWAFLALATFGLLHTFVRPRIAPALLAGFLAIFLGGISFASLHWGRWLIQILPLVALFAAWGTIALVRAGNRWMGGSARSFAISLLIAVLAISVAPAQSYFEFARLQGAPGTRDVAREWIIETIPAQARMITELYAAPLQETHFAPVPVVFSLTEVASTPSELSSAGYDFVMVSSNVYQRFFAEPGRYQREVSFYRNLFRNYPRMAEFRAGKELRGPVIQIYRVSGILGEDPGGE